MAKGREKSSKISLSELKRFIRAEAKKSSNKSAKEIEMRVLKRFTGKGKRVLTEWVI